MKDIKMEENIKLMRLPIKNQGNPKIKRITIQTMGRYVTLAIILLFTWTLNGQQCLVTTSKSNVRRGQNLQRNSGCASPTIIPVAVHFFGNFTGYNTAGDSICIRESIDRQINQLNKDFGGYNTDITNYCDLVNQGCGFDPTAIAATSCIQFVIATNNHPNITITNDPNSRFLQDGEYAVTFNKYPIAQFNCGPGGVGCTSPLFTINNDDWDGYVNIYISDTVPDNGPSGVNGAANQGSGYLADGSGVWLRSRRFGGEGVSCLVNGIVLNEQITLGRTLTHEMGHHFGLAHIFHDVNGNCTQDADGLDDTPIQNKANASGVVFLNTVCGDDDSRQDVCEGSFYFNFMDYVQDDQMYMFTNDQVAVMQSTISQNATGPKPFLDHLLVANHTPDFNPILVDGCQQPNNNFPDAPCLNVVYADYEYQCGDNQLSVTVGEEIRFNGRNCGGTSSGPTITSNNGGGGGGGSGPGNPGGGGGGGGSTVTAGVDVPVINENDECQECVKELQRKIQILKNQQNGGN